jgi:hypothetical protein
MAENVDNTPTAEITDSDDINDNSTASTIDTPPPTPRPTTRRGDREKHRIYMKAYYITTSGKPLQCEYCNKTVTRIKMSRHYGSKLYENVRRAKGIILNIKQNTNDNINDV